MRDCPRKPKIPIQILGVHMYFNVKMVLGASIISKLREYEHSQRQVFAITHLVLIIDCSSLFFLLPLSSGNIQVPRYVPLLQRVNRMKETWIQKSNADILFGLIPSDKSTQFVNHVSCTPTPDPHLSI